ncbi:MAG: type IX secretion system membrane protein PorP/SprF [Prolixibacteraceae bacterium]|nr:type IX secretion system membrane protein PorP/SprF [Prolixibacteraceae bacterium]MBN2775010.1 type IX secretion system membrane protein PorP/SprF [Prolixibacteraceae bacterium]
MKKFKSFLFFIFIFNLAVVGQQDPQFTNNAFYKLGVNPGFAGSDNAISGIILNRYQWSGFGDGAPKTLVFSAEGAIDAFGHPGGIGLNIISDELGFEKNTWVNIIYAYKSTLNVGTLGIGISGGVYNKSINGEWYVPEYEGVYTSPSSDPGIPQQEVSQMAFDIGLGLYLKANNYYAGASVTHVNQASILFDGEASTYLTRHYYLMGGYNIKLPDPLFELRSFCLFKSDLASWQVDLNANVVYNERFWGGLNYRYQDAISLLLGAELFNGLVFGYSFDVTTSAMGRYGYGSHEIFVSYSFELEKNRTRKYKSIRFL